MKEIGFICKSCMYKTDRWCTDPLCRFYDYHRMLQKITQAGVEFDSSH